MVKETKIMIRPSLLRRAREIEKAKRKKRKSHLKLREKFKWLINPPLERLSKEFKEVQQSLYIGLSGIRKELKDAVYTLNSGLWAIDQHFVTFETPIEKAAEKIARSFENFDKSKDILSKELRKEYHDELKILVEELSSYAGELVTTNDIQIKRSAKLEKDINDLSKLSVLLSDTLKIFGAMARKTDKKQKNKGENQKDEDFILGFSEELLKEFTGQYKSSNENFERLFNHVNGSLSKVTEYIQNQFESDRSLKRSIDELNGGIKSINESFKVLEKIVQHEEEKEKAADQAAEQSEERIDKMDSLIELLSEGFQVLKDQNKLLVKKINIMSDHLKKLSKPKKTKIKSHLIKNFRDSR